jgi:hypothetical protein
LEENSANMPVSWTNHGMICATIYEYNGEFILGDDASSSLLVPVIALENANPERDDTTSTGQLASEWRRDP